MKIIDQNDDFMIRVDEVVVGECFKTHIEDGVVTI